MGDISKLLWQKDTTPGWITPGGDPVWICPVCGGGRHVYGIENNEPQVVCPDCTNKLEGYDYGRNN
ncbi:MAG: hypothetical protein K5865_04915 [Eubacterium sp.]|nr:hypothetical protein [Eubacterium sp.]